MKHMVDCGSSNLCFSRRIINWRRTEGDDLHDWTIWAFDPDGGRFTEKHAEFVKDFPEPRLVMTKQAVWTEDGQMEFNYAVNWPANHLSGVKQRHKLSGTKRHSAVETVDLSRFMLETIKPGEYVVLKLDVEGAEFYILPKLQASGAALLCNRIYVEYHERANKLDWVPVKQQIMAWWAAHPQITHFVWR